MTCEVVLNALILGVLTWFWAWYLVQEAVRVKGLRPRRWYELPISEIFYRLLKKRR
jgi:hypothetical protein